MIHWLATNPVRKVGHMTTLTYTEIDAVSDVKQAQGRDTYAVGDDTLCVYYGTTSPTKSDLDQALVMIQKTDAAPALRWRDVTEARPL